MNETTPPNEPAVATDSDRDESAPSPEFASALAEHESSGQAPSAAEGPPLAVGTKVHGKVVTASESGVIVDFGGRSEGVAEARHFLADDGSLTVKPDDELDLFVVKTGDEIQLAPSMRAEKNEALAQLREAKSKNVPVTGKVTAVNSGGLDIDVSGVRGFCPMSQIELGFCSDPSQYIGRTLEFAVTSIEEAKRSVVLSRRQILKRAEKEAAKQRLETLKIGDELEGTVARLEPFGAFVDLGGIDGMVHVSEIRHERTGHPNQVLHEGEPVKVRVLRIETGKDGRPRVALSMKAIAPDPWAAIEERFQPGARIQGRVARLTDFGAFVNLAPGVDGLVHVSEIAWERIAHPKDVLKPGQTVDVVVQGVDPAKKRVSLSIKKTLEPPERPAREERPRGEGRESRGEGRDSRGGGAGGGGGPRHGRGGPRDGGRRDNRSFREGRGSREDRDERSIPEPPKAAAPEEPTTMALALRKAMEEARRKQQGGDAS
jgi:small subunit ribosomal protein S1